MKRRKMIAQSHFRTAAALLLTMSIAPGWSQVNVLTYHNDNARTGQNLQETVLTQSNVNPAQFGKLFTHQVDGNIYAQPLYVSAVKISGKGTFNMVFVATEHNSVYAFAADSGTGLYADPLWHVSFINPSKGITTVPSADTGTDDITPEIGFTGTPVIDKRTNTLFVVAKTKEAGGAYFQKLHALDIVTGREKTGSPVTITGGAKRGSGQSSVAFNPLIENQRAALLLLNNVVYVCWASHGDNGNFHGYILGFATNGLRQTKSFSVTPTGEFAGIWMGGCGPSADEDGNMYVITGNGTFDANTTGSNYGNSVLKLSTKKDLTVLDYFTPFDQEEMSLFDHDLGTQGPLLVSGLTGTHPNLIVTGSKTPDLYILNRDNLGHYNPANNSQIVQQIPLQYNNHWGSFAYFNKHVYDCPSFDYPAMYDISGDGLSPGPVATGPKKFAFPGASPSISANGTQNGIVWAIERTLPSRTAPASLHAFRAEDFTELYDSAQNGPNDALDPATKFAVPTVVNGRVYVGTQSSLSVFGLK